jgi:chromate reductase
MPFAIAALCGSLRKDSFNRKLLDAAVALCPSGAVIDVIDFADVPMFNQDLETALPAAVAALKAKIKAADGILIVTPEYNYGVPGPLKNLIDWVSRPYGDDSWDGKTVAIMGASPGMLGTARCQWQLRQIMHGAGATCVQWPEIYVSGADKKFDAHGTFTDEKGKEVVKELLQALIDQAKQMKK